MKHVIALFPLFLISQFTSGQTLEGYFSRPGLKLSSYIVSFNGFGLDTSSSSFTYVGKKALCEDTVLIFAFNQGLANRFILIEDKKVYQIFSDCSREFMYDFGLEPGQKMTGGVFADHLVTGRNEVTLENGEVRLLFELLPPISSWPVKWIEGIGDIQGGLFPFMHYEADDVFVCAQDSSGMLWSNASQLSRCDELSCLYPRSRFTYEMNEYEVSLTNESSFATHYLWDFGNGVTSTEINPVYLYQDASCNVISLTAYNECNQEGVEKTSLLPVCVSPDWDTIKRAPFNSFGLFRIDEYLQFITYSSMIQRSVDNGNTWHNVSVPPIGSFEHFGSIRMYNSNRGIGLIGRNSQTNAGSIIITEDGGLTWQLRAPNIREMQRLTIGPNGRAWACTSLDKYYLSQDYGDTWVELSDSVDFDLDEIWAFGDTLIAGVVEGSYTNQAFSMAKSFDGGYTWTQYELPLDLGYMQFLTPNIGYAYSDYGVAKTINGGETWELVLEYDGVYDINFFDPSSGWISLDTRIILYTTDGLQSYSTTNCTGTNIFSVIPVSAKKAIATTWHYFVSFDGDKELNCSSTDYDEDGYSDDIDCKDEDPDIHPGAVEIPLNGIDENCDGSDFLTNIKEINGHQISIYPNPASDFIVIGNASGLSLKIQMYDMNGTRIRSYSNLGPIDISNLPGGVYIVEIRSSYDSDGFVEKIVKF